MSVIFVTHDLGVVAATCDRMAVMYAGRIVESGTVAEVFAQPMHAYTRGLLGSVPRVGTGTHGPDVDRGHAAQLVGDPCGLRFQPALRFCDRRVCRVGDPVKPWRNTRSPVTTAPPWSQRGRR